MTATRNQGTAVIWAGMPGHGKLAEIDQYQRVELITRRGGRVERHLVPLSEIIGAADPAGTTWVRRGLEI